MVNPFRAVLNKLSLSIPDAQGTGHSHSYIVVILKVGEALHEASPTAWNARSGTAADEVLFRLRALGLEATHAYVEIARFFQENVN